MGIDETIKALGDPTRRQILRMLREGDLSAGEIGAAFPMTAPTISHHLSILRDAGLVQSQREGRAIIYSLDSTVFQDLIRQLMEMIDAGDAADSQSAQG